MLITKNERKKLMIISCITFPVSIIISVASIATQYYGYMIYSFFSLGMFSVAYIITIISDYNKKKFKKTYEIHEKEKEQENKERFEEEKDICENLKSCSSECFCVNNSP